MSAIIIKIIHIQLWAASIDGLRPSWQPAIISTLLYLYISYLANKIVVVVVVPPWLFVVLLIVTVILWANK